MGLTSSPPPTNSGHALPRKRMDTADAGGTPDYPEGSLRPVCSSFPCFSTFHLQYAYHAAS